MHGLEGGESGSTGLPYPYRLQNALRRYHFPTCSRTRLRLRHPSRRPWKIYRQMGGSRTSDQLNGDACDSGAALRRRNRYRSRGKRNERG